MNIKTSVRTLHRPLFIKYHARGHRRVALKMTDIKALYFANNAWALQPFGQSLHTRLHSRLRARMFTDGQL